MFRGVLACTLVLLSGCLAQAPVSVESLAAPVDDGMVVTATRVEPLVHEVDQRGSIEARSCASGEQDGCYNPLLLAMDQPHLDFGDPVALFWRVSLQADWESRAPGNSLTMTLYATKPCGIGCVHERLVGRSPEGHSPVFDAFEIYLREGETGVRVRLEAGGNGETAVSEARIEYHLHGGVAGYRPAGSPVVIA